MTPYEPTRRLAVNRTLADGRKVAVGTLAQNRDGVYFAYEAAYLQQHGNLSPYQLRADGSVQLAARGLPHGLHGYLPTVCRTAGACSCEIVISANRASCPRK